MPGRFGCIRPPSDGAPPVLVALATPQTSWQPWPHWAQKALKPPGRPFPVRPGALGFRLDNVRLDVQQKRCVLSHFDVARKNENLSAVVSPRSLTREQAGSGCQPPRKFESVPPGRLTARLEVIRQGVGSQDLATGIPGDRATASFIFQLPPALRANRRD